MFSKDIVRSDAFLDMPVSSQLLYFHLGMEADDDGFVDNGKTVSRMAGTAEDDMKILLSKRFLLSFNNGLLVIKHWKINNYIQSDRYKETKYVEEKGMITTKENGSYTECIQNVYGLDTQVRLGKDRLDKDTKKGAKARASDGFNPEGAEVIKAFEALDPKNKNYYGNKTQRRACDFMISEYGKEEVLKRVSVLDKTNKIPHFPVITSPYELMEKWVKLQDAVDRKRQEKTGINKRGVV